MMLLVMLLSKCLRGIQFPPQSRVAIVNSKNDKEFVELKRGSETEGFFYDSSMNAIIFKDIKDLNLTSDSMYVISYDTWSENAE